MANSVSLKLAVAVFACMLVSALYAESAITCGQVASSLIKCFPFLKSGQSLPGVPCCNGIKSLNGLAKTTPDRQAACVCLKTLARRSNANGVSPAAAASLPSKCDVNIGYPISLNTDCAKVKGA